MAKPLHLAAGILGLFFLISGIGKALDLAQFADTIALYGFPKLRFMAPLVTALELGVGVGLVMRMQLRWLALASIVLLAVFTLLFAYGYLRHGVTSCGCFGALDALQTPPWASFGRNALLLLLAGWLFYAAPTTNLRQPVKHWQRGGLAALTTVAAIGCSYLYLGQPVYRQKVLVPGQLVRTSALAEFCPADADTASTVLVFIFSPTCTHCWEATPKVLAYRASGLVSKIIALCPPSTTEQQQQYLKHFNQPFTIKVVDRDKLHQLTDKVPTAIFIQQAKVIKVLTTHMPAADSLKTALMPMAPSYANAL